MFTPPEEQIRHLLEINEQVWKDGSITEKAISAIGDPPDCPSSHEKALYCVTLVNDTGDVSETFERNWQVCIFTHGREKTWKWLTNGFKWETLLRLRQNAIPRPKGLRWVIAELGRTYQGQNAEDVRVEIDRNGRMGIGPELPAIAAMHQQWALSMNSNDIPLVYAPDLEVSLHMFNITVGKFLICMPNLEASLDDEPDWNGTCVLDLAPGNKVGIRAIPLVYTHITKSVSAGFLQ